MGRRSRHYLDKNDTPPLQIFRPLHVAGTEWEIIKREESTTIKCQLRLGGFQPDTSSYNDPAMPFGGKNACWQLKVTRAKAMEANGKNMPQEGFAVYLSYLPEGDSGETMFEKLIYRGRELRWPKAVREIKLYAPVVEEMQKMGKEIYSNGKWITMRPFKVQFPWSNPKEPNRFYSPFQLCGGWTLDDTCDGEAISVYMLPTENNRQWNELRKIMQTIGANAFVTKKDADYVVYHRRGMTEADPIDIDDWRTRIIAGTGERFDDDE